MKKKTPSVPATVHEAEVVKDQPQQSTAIRTVPGIDELVGLAVTGNYDLDKLQRLLDMKDKYDKENAKKEFIRAMSALKSEIGTIKKSSKVRFVSDKTQKTTSYNYADASSIEEALKPLLLKHGFSYSYDYAEVPNPIDPKGPNWIEVACIVSHVGGHERITKLKGAPDTSGSKNSIQSSGSTVTYLERYTLKGAFGLATAQDDTDGVGSTDPEPKYQGNDLPIMGDLEFDKVISKVRTEGWTIEKIEQSWTLGPDQRSAIEAILKAKKG